MTNDTTLDRLEYYRAEYAARVMDWTPATARYERRAAALLSASTRVLDLGCGRGGISERLHTRGRWIGIDPDGASVREHRVGSLARAQAGAGRLPFPAATFDLVVSSWVLEHLPDPDAVFQEVSRVLKPGGRFLALTPNARHPIPRASRWLDADGAPATADRRLGLRARARRHLPRPLRRQHTGGAGAGGNVGGITSGRHHAGGGSILLRLDFL